MAVDDETFDHLQRLARLRVPEADRATLKEDLEKVLAFVAQLEEIDVSGVDELTRPLAGSGVTRPDTPAPSLPREVALKSAPAQRDGFFEVPRTVEES